MHLALRACLDRRFAIPIAPIVALWLYLIDKSMPLDVLAVIQNQTVFFAFIDPRTATTDGYLTGDGLAPSGFPVQSATSFPSDPDEGDFVLRLDFYPNRLFRYDGNKWVKIEDKVRYSYIPDESRSQLGSFINTAEEFSTKDGRTFNTQQALSSAIKPKADNT